MLVAKRNGGQRFTCCERSFTVRKKCQVMGPCRLLLGDYLKASEMLGGLPTNEGDVQQKGNVTGDEGSGMLRQKDDTQQEGEQPNCPAPTRIAQGVLPDSRC